MATRHFTRQFLGAMTLAVFTTACSTSPVAPSTPPPSTTAPAFLNIGANVLTGASAGHALITVHVLNVNGVQLEGVHVTFVTSAGTLSVAEATTDKTGTADTELITTDVADVLIQAGSLTAHQRITPAAPPPVPPPPIPPIITPPPPPPPPPTPPLPPAPLLAVTVSCVAAAHGAPTSCNVGATNENGLIVTSQITRVDWDWGDGTTSTTATPLAQQTYSQAGVYVVLATATGPGGRVGRGTVSVNIS